MQECSTFNKERGISTHFAHARAAWYLTPNILRGGGGKLSHAMQNLVKSARVRTIINYYNKTYIPVDTKYNFVPWQLYIHTSFNS